MIKTVQKVKISAPPRLHLGLIDCGNATHRMYGGAGVAIDGHLTELYASPTERWEVSFLEKVKISTRTQKEVENLIDSIQEKISPSKILVKTSPPEHIGLGSKTTLLLAIATAAYASVGEPLDQEAITKLVKRGGASGIGINSFWTGGLVVDGGHQVPKHERIFAPSSFRVVEKTPPVIAKVKMPKEWKVSLFSDPNAGKIDGLKEADVFRRVTPIEDIQCLTTLSLIYHGILPSIHEKNLELFQKSIVGINNIGMKKIEVDLQTNSTKKFLQLLWENNIAAGVSSFGPCIYVIDVEESEKHQYAMRLSTEMGLSNLGTYDFRNRGVSVKKINNAK